MSVANYLVNLQNGDTIIDLNKDGIIEASELKIGNLTVKGENGAFVSNGTFETDKSIKIKHTNNSLILNENKLLDTANVINYEDRVFFDVNALSDDVVMNSVSINKRNKADKCFTVECQVVKKSTNSAYDKTLLKIDASNPDLVATTLDGSVSATSFNTTSDDRLKHNEVEIREALEMLDDVLIYKYDKTSDMKDADFKGDVKESHTKEVGVIAQQIAEIKGLESLVMRGDATKPYSVNYTGLVGFLIVAVKELNSKVKALEEKILD